MKKLVLSALAIATLGLTSCEKEVIKEVVKELTENNLSGNLTEDRTLEAGKEYNLTGALFVKDGATLTIEPGVTIKALAGGTSVYVLVEKGGKIMANGTAEAPIKFTSSADEPLAGNWGGLIINGKAPLSRQTGKESSAGTEVNSGVFFGGSDVADNSGVLNYVIIEYTGARIDGEAEHNGLTLNGVGNGTKISNIYINNGDDDAIEFFGGSVNVSNIFVVNAKDDMFDFSQGYTGTCTNLYGIREAGYTAVTSDPRGIEADGNLDGLSPTDINQSNFTVNGITIINNGGIEMNAAIKVRRGATANITNAYVTAGTGSTYKTFIDLEDKAGDATAATKIMVTGNPANELSISNNKNAPGATITATEGTTGGADASVFAWTGYKF